MMKPSIDRLPTSALLRGAYNALARQIFAAVASGHGFDDLRPAHGNVMEQLELEDGLRLTELAARAGITAQSMGELVTDLEAKNYVERQPDPDDRRAKRIYLTQRGRANVRVARRAVAHVEESVKAMLGDPRHRTLRRMLMQIIAEAPPVDETESP